MNTCLFSFTTKRTRYLCLSLLHPQGLCTCVKNQSFINCCYDHKRCTKLGRELVMLRGDWKCYSSHTLWAPSPHIHRSVLFICSFQGDVSRKLGHSRRCSPEEDGFMAVYILVCNTLNAEVTEEIEPRNGLG